jgi:predicted PurR-regulated permease PerM
VDKRLVRSLMLLIAFTVFLILIIIRFDSVIGLIVLFIDLFRPLIIGFAIAFILHRPCNFFCRLYDRGLSHTKAAKAALPLAVLSSYLCLIAVLALVISLIVPQLATSISLLAHNLNAYITNLQTWINGLVDRYDWSFLKSLDFTSLSDTLKNLINKALSMISSTIPQIFTFTSTLITGLITTFIALIMSIYMLGSGKKLLFQIRRTLEAYLPEKISAPLFDITELTADTFSRFITGLLTEACILATLCFIGMSILHFQYAPLICILVGSGVLIPMVGAFCAATLSAFLLLMVSPMQALWFLVFIIILHQIEGNLIYPRVVGSSIGLPALWVLTAITVGGGLFGFIGILISVPITSVLYTLLKRDVARRRALKNAMNK